jgi:hypothetical protein
VLFNYSFVSTNFLAFLPSKPVVDLRLRQFSIPKILGLLLILSALGLAFPQRSLGQVPLKKDYIVVADTALSQGVVRDLPSEHNTVIYFARTKRDDDVRYTVHEITEFRISERLFFRKEVELDGKPSLVFLEKLPRSVPGATIWKLNGPPNRYYLETPQGIQLLEDDYQELLKGALNNPMIDPLLELTKLNDFSLVYLFRAAASIERPRTFSRLFVITPYLGYSSQTVGLSFPDSDHQIKVTGSSPAVGVNGEVFLTFKRNLSLNFGVLWTQFSSQDFVQYQYNQKRYDSDVFLNFTLLQAPITAKYYLDLTPNKWRLFGEVGYSHAIASYDKLVMYQAKFEENGVVTSRKELEMGESFSGYAWGVGVERYLSKHRGMVLGIRQFRVSGTRSEFVQGLTFQLGYKF